MSLRFLILLSFVLTGAALGQGPYKTGSVPPDTMKLSTIQFSRSLQTFLWNGRINYEAQVSGLHLDFDQTLRSRLIRSVQNSIQDELGTRLFVRSSVSDRWDVKGEARSIILSDNRQLDLGNLSQHQILAGTGYRGTPGISASFLGGYEFASQERVRDRGFAYRADLQGRGVSFGEFDLAFDARSGKSFLTPRRLGVEVASLSVIRDYGGSTVNALHVLYANQLREFYTTADPDVQRDYQRQQNIFRRVESAISVSDTLEYRSGGSSSLFVHAGYGSRTIERGYRYKSFSNPAGVLLNSRIEEARLFGGVALQTAVAEWLQGSARLAYEERDESHDIVRQDDIPLQTADRQEQSAKRLSNISRRSTLGVDLQSRLTERDRLNFSGSAGILRYDTPDSLNRDDRDELLLVVGVEAIHRFHPGLVLSVLGDVTLSHLVYLSRFQSANNNWNRIFRLKTHADYSPASWMTTVNTAEVLANYTVYDFEEQIASVRSFSFRQASWTDSTSLKLGTRTELLILASLRVYERGILKWQEFSERPENYFVEQSYWPQVFVGVLDHLTLGVGYRYFSQARFRYEGRRRVFEQRLVNEGPTVQLRWRGSNNGTIALEGWRETQQGAGGTRTYSNVSMIVGIAL